MGFWVRFYARAALAQGYKMLLFIDIINPYKPIIIHYLEVL